ncbi:MAG: hypothetical protein Q9212_006228 [Teloschistes hypoglaucus]
MAYLSPEVVRLYNCEEPLLRLLRPKSVFTSNSTATKVTLQLQSPEIIATNIFCERSQNPLDEINGAANSATFPLNVQLPQVARSGELLYPFFEGMSESELHFSIHRGGFSDASEMETLLYAEMVKAEDMLQVYKESLRMPNDTPLDAVQQPIDRLFHSRLVHNTRLRESYGESVCLGEETLSMSEFLRAPWKVSGKIYPSLGELFSTAADVLHPQSEQYLSCPIAFGLGDAHGGNVMIADQIGQNGSREILYVDYENAGFHPVLLDLAKPFYNDVFFDTLYMDVLPNVPETRCKIEGGYIDVQFTPDVDSLSQAVFEIKRRYILRPLFEHALSLGWNLENNIPLLSNALFVCATLTRNYSNNATALVRNTATGIVLTGAVDMDRFYAGLDTLGPAT